MNKRRMKELWAAKLPKLNGLTLWFGSEDQGVDCGVAELGVAALQKAFPYLQAKDQKSPWEDDPEFRYVSVGE